MKSSKYNRRKFLSTVTASAAGGIFVNSTFPFSAEAQTSSLLSGQDNKSEYLFAEGLTYLNTGTIGPCRRETVRESMKMWEELESLPVKSYGLWGAESL